MTDKRKKDVNWHVADDEGCTKTWAEAHAALLMDIRDELKRLNSAIYCPNFQRIPKTLTDIRRNTAKKKRKVHS